MIPDATYIHGTDPLEQKRLADLNRLTNAPFIEFLKVRPGERVLEVGSGLGMLAGEVATRRASVTGLERSPDQLAIARIESPDVEFVEGDAHRLPFPDDSFNLVYCRYLLEHVGDPLRVLTEMRRVAKPGGRIAVQENDNAVDRPYPEIPGFHPMWDRFNQLQIQYGGDPYIGRKLYSLFVRAGLAEIEVSLQPEVHAGNQSTFALWIENIIGNIEGAANGLVETKLADRSEIEDVIESMRRWMGNPEACAYFYWNRAAGVKP